MPTHDHTSVIEFLADLSFNNNRTWFEEHKGSYEKARDAFVGLVNELIGRLSLYEDMSGVTPKNSIMRIYRDVRFSKDKTPYNAWMAAHIAPGGKKSGSLGFGLRLSPGVSGSAGGLWTPSPDQLTKFRRAIKGDFDTFDGIVKAPDFIRRFGGLQGESLKTVPKGYDKDHPAAEFIKLKQIYVIRTFGDDAVYADDFMDQLVEDYLVMKPFLDYLNKVAV
jgi:uncharacterized protein (TIGR02453 family)